MHSLSRSGRLCLAGIAALFLAVQPAMSRAEAQAPKATAQTPSLQERIKAAYDAKPPIYLEKDAIARLKPLMDEALAMPGLDADDFAAISVTYALALDESGDVAGARQVIERALEAMHKAGRDETKLAGQLLRSLGSYQTRSGDPEGGIITLKKVLVLYQKLYGPDSSRVGSVYSSLAFSVSRLGRLGEALDYYALALPRMTPEDPRPATYSAFLGNYADQVRAVGDFDLALSLSRQSLEVELKYLPDDHRGIGWAYARIASALLDLGRNAEAVDASRKAVDHAVQYCGKSCFETGDFLYGLGRALNKQGRHDEAEAILLDASVILQAHPNDANPFEMGVVWNDLGRLAYERGDTTLAEQRLRQGLGLLDALGARGVAQKSAVQTNLAELLMTRGNLTEAQALIEAALAYYQKYFPPHAGARVNAEMLHALILARQGRTTQALELAAPIAQAMQDRLGNPSSARSEQMDLAVSYQQNFARYADIALAAQRPDLAFEAAQMATMSELATTSQAMAARAAARDPKAAGLARQLQDAQVARLKLDRERSFALGKSESELKRLETAMADADASLQALQTSLDQVFPQYETLSHPRPARLGDVQKGLGPDEAMFMPLLSDDRLITLVVTVHGLTWDSTPLNRMRAQTDVIALRKAVDGALASPDATTFDRAPAWELGQAMFTPKVAAALRTSKQLDIMGSGPLMSLPFSLLLTAVPQGRDDDADAQRQSAWLIKRFALTVKPAFIARTAKPATAKGFLGIGAPVLGPEGDGFAGMTQEALYRGDANKAAIADTDALRRLPSLPKAGAELSRMRAAFGMAGSALILGADATETRLKTTDLSQYSVIAFATHGLISGNLATLREPALVLTPPATATEIDDGLLTASDVAGLRLNARWVILSACNTGSGREDGAAGYSGLAKAFMQAGAQSLLVSLWPVRDDVAERLSVDTVRRNAHGQSQAQALRGAILSLIGDTRVKGAANPAIWAPFSLIVR